MASEFIKLTGPEVEYGDRNLLHSQLDLLLMIKRYQSYEEIRKEELQLKIKLKKLVSDVKSHLDHLEKMLPKTKLGLEEEKMEIEIPEKVMKAIPKMPAPKTRIKAQKLSPMETEVESLKRKLASLG